MGIHTKPLNKFYIECRLPKGLKDFEDIKEIEPYLYEEKSEQYSRFMTYLASGSQEEIGNTLNIPLELRPAHLDLDMLSLEEYGLDKTTRLGQGVYLNRTDIVHVVKLYREMYPNVLDVTNEIKVLRDEMLRSMDFICSKGKNWNGVEGESRLYPENYLELFTKHMCPKLEVFATPRPDNYNDNDLIIIDNNKVVEMKDLWEDIDENELILSLILYFVRYYSLLPKDKVYPIIIDNEKYRYEPYVTDKDPSGEITLFLFTILSTIKEIFPVNISPIFSSNIRMIEPTMRVKV